MDASPAPENLFEGVELPDKLLEALAGGSLKELPDEGYRIALANMLAQAKERGASLELTAEALERLAKAPLTDDVRAALDEAWKYGTLL